MSTKKAAKPARKGKASPDHMRAMVSRIRTTAGPAGSVKRACEIAGVNEATFYRWAAWVAKNPVQRVGKVMQYVPKPNAVPEPVVVGVPNPPDVPADAWRLRVVCEVSYRSGAALLHILKNAMGANVIETIILEPQADQEAMRGKK